MKLITRTLSALALSVVIASPIALVGAVAVEAHETKTQEPAVTLVKFKKYHGFKKHHGFKKFYGFKKF